MAELGFKIKFTKSVFGATQRAKIKKEILQAVESSPEYRKEVARVFQMANRRIQNIEQSGQLSPAVQALNKGDIKGFTKFSMKGDWNTLKIEYGKAISFLRQPTSTAQGARQYGQHLQRMYDLTPDEYNLMARNLQGKLNSVSDSDFVERYLMRYKDFTGEMEQSASDISTQIESEAQSISRAIDAEIERQANEVADQMEDTQNDIERILSNFGKFGL
jgi:Mg2+ and Co2+ transporter CorA